MPLEVNNSKCLLDIFRKCLASIAMVQSKSFWTIWKPQWLKWYEHVKYRISNPIRKRREMDTQFRASKHNFILNLIDKYRILWKVYSMKVACKAWKGIVGCIAKSVFVNLFVSVYLLRNEFISRMVFVLFCFVFSLSLYMTFLCLSEFYLVL